MLPKIILLLFATILSSILALGPPPKVRDEECENVPTEDKFDCYPDEGPTPELCEARGCCWIPVEASHEKVGVKVDVPYCFFPTSRNAYEYLNVTETSYGVEAYLGQRFASAYPNDIEILRLVVKYETADRLNVKIIDPHNERFESPYPEVPNIDVAASETNYKFEIDDSRPGFRVLRADDDTILFDSNDFINFVYADQYIQIGTRLTSQYIYGIGEQQSSLALSTDWNEIVLFSRDVAPSPNVNLYGVHPFYISFENSGKAHGVFLLNTNALEVILQPKPAITFRTIGGVLNFYFFLGPTPSDVVKQYQEVVGKPTMPPYWGLGYHLCKYGYGTLEETKRVWQRNVDAGIPLDVQWNDIDYMDRYNDFTYDKESFAGLPEFVEELHSRNMHYMMITDPGVSASEEPGTYPPYDVGIEMGIFVKNTEGQPLIGKVWNTQSTAFPDFTHPNATAYWTQVLLNFHDEVPFDGIWIDMNEPSNFVDGSLEGCPESTLEDPPYVPNVLGGKLRASTLCMTGQQAAGNHYDLHNQYGFTEAIVTNQAMKSVTGKRPMIISRSTYAGFGRYAGHWSGDIHSTWEDLRYSIPNLLSFSLFGIPLMGADICGFLGDTNEKLCNRWQQLGAFYPFSRNHNNAGARDQDPVAMGDLVIASTKMTLQLRYSLLPYLYTLFYRASVDGETVARPLFLEFPDDENTYRIDNEFLWGSGILITPVLEEDAISVSAYIPKGTWYYGYTGEKLTTSGDTITVDAPDELIPFWLRGGYILPGQVPAQTTAESRNNLLYLNIFLDENEEAKGEIFWDDGESINTIEDERYTLISMTLADKTLNINPEVYNSDEEIPSFSFINVWGITGDVTQVTINGDQVEYNYSNGELVVNNLQSYSLRDPIEIQWQ